MLLWLGEPKGAGAGVAAPMAEADTSCPDCGTFGSGLACIAPLMIPVAATNFSLVVWCYFGIDVGQGLDGLPTIASACGIRNLTGSISRGLNLTISNKDCTYRSY